MALAGIPKRFPFSASPTFPALASVWLRYE